MAIKQREKNVLPFTDPNSQALKKQILFPWLYKSMSV